MSHSPIYMERWMLRMRSDSDNMSMEKHLDRRRVKGGEFLIFYDAFPWSLSPEFRMGFRVFINIEVDIHSRSESRCHAEMPFVTWLCSGFFSLASQERYFQTVHPQILRYHMSFRSLHPHGKDASSSIHPAPALVFCFHPPVYQLSSLNS